MASRAAYSRSDRPQTGVLMNIDGQAEFEHTGNTYLQVRDRLRVMCAQSYVHRYWFEESQGKHLNNPADLFDVLVERGYLEPLEGDRATGQVWAWDAGSGRFEEVVARLYRTSTKGHALANASAAKPVSRATADKALASFLQRVEHVATDPMNLYVVDRVVLFGSMLDPTRERLSDVDLAVSLARNDAVYDAAGHNLAGSVFLTEMNGGKHSSGYRGESGIRKFLKNRSRVLSLALLSEEGKIAGLSAATTPHRVIYQRSTE